MDENIRQLVHAIRMDPEESTRYNVLADAMKEAGVPGHEVVQAAGEHARRLDPHHGWTGIPDSARARRILQMYYGVAPGGGFVRNGTPPGPDHEGTSLPPRLDSAHVAGHTFLAVPHDAVRLSRSAVAQCLHRLGLGQHNEPRYSEALGALGTATAGPEAVTAAMPHVVKLSKTFVSNKIKKLIGEGKPQKQAVAIALSMERRGK